MMNVFEVANVTWIHNIILIVGYLGSCFAFVFIVGLVFRSGDAIKENEMLRSKMQNLGDVFHDARQYEVRRGMYRRGRGYVYLLQDIDVTGYCKIGRTVDPPRRIGKFDTMLPFRCDILAIIKTDDCVQLETTLHHQYADKRVRGEWFDLTDDDIAQIRAM